MYAVSDRKVLSCQPRLSRLYRCVLNIWVTYFTHLIILDTILRPFYIVLRYTKQQFHLTYNNIMVMPSVKCQNCGINRLCLPVCLNESDVEQLDSIVRRSKPIKKHSVLYHAGESFNGIHVVRSGCLKSYITSRQGEEQILGFYLPGEIIGLNAFDTGVYPSSAKALETSTICSLPYEKLDDLAAYIPNLRQQLMRIMSRKILNDQELVFMLNKKNVDQRLAAFIINLSARYGQRGGDAHCFRLTMKKSDIANYLGMAIETISRLFGKFESSGLIQKNNKEIIINDIGSLSQLAGTSCHL